MEAFIAKFVTPYMIWFKIAGLVAIFLAGMWLEGRLKDTEIANAKADRMEEIAANATAALDQYGKDVDRIHGAASEYAALLPQFRGEFSGLAKDFKNAINKRPLPAGCVLDPDRLRPLSAAVAATNRATAGRIAIPAVRPNP